MEEGICVLWSNAREQIRDRYHKCENRIRESPTTAVLGAAAVGYLLHRLPMRAILVTQVRVLAALAPPAFLLLGAAKLCEFLQQQELCAQKETESWPEPRTASPFSAMSGTQPPHPAETKPSHQP
jgi:hypothetical protein